MLIEAITDSFHLYALMRTRWDVRNLDFDYYRGVARFILDHYECRAFFVKGEYADDPVIVVEPREPVWIHLGASI